MSKITTYVLMLSDRFPVGHISAGLETGFEPKVMAAKNNMPCYRKKIHAVLANYDLWKKRFEKINAGQAVLSIRQWVGKPYGKGSSQKELWRLTKDDGIGLQKFVLDIEVGEYVGTIKIDDEKFSDSTILEIATNDGLSPDDWAFWFPDYKYGTPLAIIHFTSFRYKQSK